MVGSTGDASAAASLVSRASRPGAGRPAHAAPGRDPGGGGDPAHHARGAGGGHVGRGGPGSRPGGAARRRRGVPAEDRRAGGAAAPAAGRPRRLGGAAGRHCSAPCCGPAGRPRSISTTRNARCSGPSRRAAAPSRSPKDARLGTHRETDDGRAAAEVAGLHPRRGGGARRSRRSARRLNPRLRADAVFPSIIATRRNEWTTRIVADSPWDTSNFDHTPPHTGSN